MSEHNPITAADAQVAGTDETTAQTLAALATLSTTSFATTAELISTALNVLMDIVGTRSAFVAEITPEIMRVVDAHDRDGCGIPAGGVLPTTESFCQYVRASQEPVVVTDSAQDVRVRHVASRYKYTIGAYVGVPLTLRDGSFYGTLCLLDPQPRTFRRDELQAVTIVARLIALRLEYEMSQYTITAAATEIQEDLSAVLGELERRDDLLRIVAHDLRYPLNTISGCANLILQRTLGHVSLQQSRALLRVKESAQHMNRLINDLLDAASVRDQPLSILSYPYEAGALIGEIVDDLRAMAAHKGVRLHYQPPFEPLTVEGDTDRMRQIVVNLIDIALQRGTGTVQVLVEPAEQDGGMFAVRVHSTPAVNASETESLHNRLDRDEQEKQRTMASLEWFVIQRLTEAMGGTVDVWMTAPGVYNQVVHLPRQGPAPHHGTWRGKADGAAEA
jgi:signal transduction histidine kinase